MAMQPGRRWSLRGVQAKTVHAERAATRLQQFEAPKRYGNMRYAFAAGQISLLILRGLVRKEEQVSGLGPSRDYLAGLT
jgi:hypothetical protein